MGLLVWLFVQLVASKCGCLFVCLSVRSCVRVVVRLVGSVSGLWLFVRLRICRVLYVRLAV